MSASSQDLCTRAWLPAGDYDFNVGTLDGPPALVPSPSLLDQLQLNPLSSSASRIPGTVAVHLHAYHLSESLQICDRLQTCLPKAQLLITTDTAEKQLALENHLTSCWNKGAASAVIRRVANRGRNVLPLLEEGLPFLSQADLALHLHSKGSNADWLNHQLNTLLGDERWSTGITQLLLTHPQLGLLMPRPPEALRPYLGWAGNSKAAEKLIQQLWPGCEFPVQAPLVFPAGMMFWFKPQALASLQQATQINAALEPEPLPNDGSHWHALERLTAHACERAGFGWAMVGDQIVEHDSNAADKAEQIWRRPISVWREEPVAYQQGMTILSKQYRLLQGNVRHLTQVEQNLRHTLTTQRINYEQHVSDLHADYNQHFTNIQKETEAWRAEMEQEQRHMHHMAEKLRQEVDTAKKQLDSIYKQTTRWVLHRIVQRLLRLWAGTPREESK